MLGDLSLYRTEHFFVLNANDGFIDLLRLENDSRCSEFLGHETEVVSISALAPSVPHCVSDKHADPGLRDIANKVKGLLFR